MDSQAEHIHRKGDEGKLIRDSGKGPAIQEDQSRLPVRTASYAECSGTSRLAIDNRERKAGVDHEMWIDNVKLLEWDGE